MGRSAALVVRGEPGIGKTTLLRYLADSSAADFRLVEIAGVESEMELAYAGLHQLCLPMLDHLDSLPDPQQSALSVSFGLTAGTAPGRFFVGLATLSLLAEMAEAQPLMCLVDDAQWLDDGSFEVLGFVARRLAAESVAMVFAIRDPRRRRTRGGAASACPSCWLPASPTKMRGPSWTRLSSGGWTSGFAIGWWPRLEGIPWPCWNFLEG